MLFWKNTKLIAKIWKGRVKIQISKASRKSMSWKVSWKKKRKLLIWPSKSGPKTKLYWNRNWNFHSFNWMKKKGNLRSIELPTNQCLKVFKVQAENLLLVEKKQWFAKMKWSNNLSKKGKNLSGSIMKQETASWTI